MNKRGSWVVIGIIIAVIAVFVGIVLPATTKDLASGKIALKTAAARDIAFVIDSIYSYPYDVELEYDYDLSDFKVKISNGKVQIYESKYSTPDKDVNHGAYNFAPVNDNPDFTLSKPKKIIFRKTGDRLTIIKGDGLTIT